MPSIPDYQSSPVVIYVVHHSNLFHKSVKNFVFWSMRTQKLQGCRVFLSFLCCLVDMRCMGGQQSSRCITGRAMKSSWIQLSLVHRRQPGDHRGLPVCGTAYWEQGGDQQGCGAHQLAQGKRPVGKHPRSLPPALGGLGDQSWLACLGQSREKGKGQNTGAREGNSHTLGQCNSVLLVHTRKKC